MIDTRYLQDLLAILKLHNVKHIKMQGLELSLNDGRALHLAERSAGASPTIPDNSVQNIADVIKKQEESMPPDLRADSLMDQDKILNWSSPDQPHDQPELPLTGEQPL